MKKFVSMAMVAAMTVSMVPATAFAGDSFEGAYKVVNVNKLRDTEAFKDKAIATPELQVKLTDVATQATNGATGVEFTITLDGAKFQDAIEMDSVKLDGTQAVTLNDSDNELVARAGDIYATVKLTDADKDEATVKVWSDDPAFRFKNGDYVAVDLLSTMKGKKDAFVSVDSDDITFSSYEDQVFVDVMNEGVKATVTKLAKVAVEEVTTLEKDLKIESEVGKFVDGQVIELKLSNGFEFAADLAEGDTYNVLTSAEGETSVKIEVDGTIDKIVIDAKAMKIESTSAKEGTIGTLTVKVSAKDNAGVKLPTAFAATTKVEVVEVTDYKVVMSVDEDMDVPVIYSGVSVDNEGITDDSDHVSLEVTIKETFPGAWSMHKDFTLELPEGVYVTAVKANDTDTMEKEDGKTVMEAFEAAYRELDHKGFEFAKRTFRETDPNEPSDADGHELTFELTLVADPGFVGDVDLKLTGEAVDEQEVTIATFATPYYVTAEQNDLKIDYRYTEVPSVVTIKEAEPGLWAEKSWINLSMEHADQSFFEFEDASVAVDEASGMEIESSVAGSIGAIGIEIKEESDEAATITISDMELFMSRSIPAGPYDLEASTYMAKEYMNEVLFAPDTKGDYVGADHEDPEEELFETVEGEALGYAHDHEYCDAEYYVGCVADFSSTVKEAFVNIVTAGREQDDASFTTKVVVPVGESYIVAGEHQVSLDVPAYVSAAGYTMLPVRAVATALGINNNNVIWNGESRTVTILYGQRIITMAAGEKTVHVNGSVIPASAAVEIVDGRTFLPMRDLATALGVTDITWDAATKTATLNGNA